MKGLGSGRKARVLPGKTVGTRCRVHARTLIMARSVAHTVLVGDIGGTNCRLQAWELDQEFKPLSLVKQHVSPFRSLLPPRAMLIRT